MDFQLTDAQEAVTDLAWQILESRAPATEGADVPPAGTGWPDERLWQDLAEANLLGIALAEDVGGNGLGLLELGLLLEQLGRAAARVPGWPTLVTAWAIDEYGTEEQRRELLPGVAAGDVILSAALVEPDMTDHAVLSTTAAPTDGGGWSVTGEKTCVPFADQAARVLIPAATPDGGVVLLLVDPDEAALTPQETTSGEPQAAVTLDRVTVGADAALAEAGPGGFGQLLDVARVAVSAVMLGVSEQALTMTASYVSEREQFGRPLATFQSIAVQAADAYIDAEAMRSTVWQALWRLDAGLPAAEAVTLAKFWASEAGERIASSTIHLHGGIGVDTDYPLHHYFLRSKGLELTLGSASLQLDRLGRQLAAG